MKKQLKAGLLSTLAVLGVASAASCGGTSSSSQVSNSSGSSIEKTTDLNIAINHSKKYGVSYREADTSKLDYGDNLILSSGDILPTWKCLGEKLNVNVIDGADYAHSQQDNWTQYINEGFKDEDGNLLDLIMGKQSLYESAIAKNKLVAISDHLNEMPNLKAWVENNKSTWVSMKSTDGKVYFTPYFDGLDDIEKMNLMNTDWVVKLLDESGAPDTEKTLKANKYVPTVESNESAKVNVWDGSKKRDITVNYSTTANPIYKQNLESVLNGSNLLKQLKAGLIAEYGNYIAESAGGSAKGSDIIYNNLSEIFVSEKACYNVDDLIALLRSVYTNPKLLTGDKDTKITPIVPRGSVTGRQYLLGEMASWWGVRGVSGENGNLYFDVDGNLKDARTNDDTYQALNNLHSIYEEGLIYEGFASKDNCGTDDMYRKSGITNGTIFMTYDYSTSTAQYNSDVPGKTAKINLTAVMPPVAKWAGSSSVYFDGEEYKDYFHYTEDNRALKTGGWAIPTSSDNLSKALEMMDYLFSETGSLIQDFGPDYKYQTTSANHKAGEYVYWTPYSESNLKLTLAGVEQPEITEAITTAIKNSSLSWSDYYRKYVGSTHGIGHVRHAGLDYECLFSESGRNGAKMLSKAMEDKVLVRAKTTFDSETSLFCNSVPTSIPLAAQTITTYTNNNAYKTMMQIWNNGTNGLVWTGSYIIMNGWEDSNVKAIVQNYDALKAIFAEYDKVYTTQYQAGFKAMGVA